MNYRALGRTGINISEVSLGCEHLDGKSFAEVDATINTALDNGVNAMDIFMPGREIRENIAKALGRRRKDVFVQGHIGSTDVNQQYDISRDMPTVQRYFEDMLRIFGYIDFGMLFFIDGDKNFDAVFNGGMVEYAQKLKQQGDIRHIGFSSHNPATAIKVIETGVVDMMMFSINPAFDMLPAAEYALSHLDGEFTGELFRGIDPKRTELYNLCQKNQVGITVMKSLAGGKLISAGHSPFEKPMSVHQCIHYALSRPAVAGVMLGCATPGEVEAAMAYFDMSNEEKDYTDILNTVSNDFAGHCVYCNHCQPCPVDIDIATVNKYLDMAALGEGVSPSLKSHYNDLESNGKDCVSCGSCEEKCPFGVPVMENMIRAEEMFR